MCMYVCVYIYIYIYYTYVYSTSYHSIFYYRWGLALGALGIAAAALAAAAVHPRGRRLLRCRKSWRYSYYCDYYDYVYQC